MGQSAKKKKRGGKRTKGKALSKDHASNYDDNELLSEEITALCAIFQDDCNVVQGSQINIKLRSFSKDMGYEDLDVSALLSVRCLPGYPYKCPKLQIIPEKGMTEEDAEKLLSLLQDQANSNARKGRVMIFNLVVAAQEFLSEIDPVRQSHETILGPSTNSSDQLVEGLGVLDKKSSSSRPPVVYGVIDLFTGSGESWHWSLGMDENRDIISPVKSHSLDVSKPRLEASERKFDKNVKSLTPQSTKLAALLSHSEKLDALKEESDAEKSTFSSDSSRSLEESGCGSIKGEKKVIFLEENRATDDDSDFDPEPSGSDTQSFSSLNQHKLSQITQKDLAMVNLLRLACISQGPLGDALPTLATELHTLGILSEEMLDLTFKPSSLFNETIKHVFGQHMVSSKVPQFWEPASNLDGLGTSVQNSRYLNDFEELKPLGHGGFGHVVLCTNKLDGRQYAVKKIRLKEKILPTDDRILSSSTVAKVLREVATLSRLQHQHVVRYYQAWSETGVLGLHGEASWGSGTAASSMFSNMGASSADVSEHDNKLELTFLYIQMEYCPRTLRQMFDSYNHFDKDLAWHLCRQIVEGLAHIHGQGIIHRDLTPNNIFFDARNDIKIGDFGLAKFLKLEQLDQDAAAFPTGTIGVSIEGTGQVGTYFYTAPEIEQGWPKIDEKADMYSLGIVFFEIWHPFGTAMERHIVLSDLKQKGELPATWVSEFPEQASLLRRLMSSIPSDRPSATELLQHAFPPRMETEEFDNTLRTMHTSEDSSVYDKVVNSIFDEEEMKRRHQRSGKVRIGVEDTSSIQYADFETELRDYAVETTREIFKLHCAKHLKIIPMRLLDDCPQYNRNTVKLLTRGGDMLELCHELRLPFVRSVITKQKSSFDRYEISSVYRRAIGHSPPNHYLQGDFDIIEGATALAEAEVLKVTEDIITQFFHRDSCDIRLNHGDLIDAIWSWAGIKVEHRHKVAELLSLMGSLRPQSSERKLKWGVIRRQLLQELNLDEAVVNRLQAVSLRFCGTADEALPRLRGALPADKRTRRALDELADLFSYLRVWRIEENVFIDALMPPTESYYRDLFFQVYLTKENSSGSFTDGVLLAVGGRYDYLLHEMCGREYKTNPLGGVGLSLAIETIIDQHSRDFRPIISPSVLVCSRGGGGLLYERMELAAELWKEKIKALYVRRIDPSLTEQYEYASERDIKCLVIITDTGVLQTGFVKVRHLELKKEKEIQRDELVRFLLDAMATHFRKPSLWN